MLFNPLPSTLAIDKPRGQESYKPSVLEKLQKLGALIGTRKSDGHQLRAEVCEGRRVRLYTRRMHPVDNRLDYLREEIADARLPEGTLLAGELVIRDAAGRDDEAAVGSLMSSSKENASVLLGRGPLPQFVPFNLLLLRGSTLKGLPYADALQMLSAAFNRPAYVVPTKPMYGLLADMMRTMSQEDWEGLVLYDRGYTLSFRLKGDPATPHGCYKYKPQVTDDFIVFRRQRKVHADGSLEDVTLLQWDPERRKLFYCGRLGAFDAAMKKRLVADDWDVLVLEVKFVRRWPKKGTLREPAFVRLRDPKDKDADLCIAPKSYPEAELLK